MKVVAWKNILFLCIPLMFCVLPVFAETPETVVNGLEGLNKLISAKSLKCTFGPGASVSWEAGEQKIH